MTFLTSYPGKSRKEETPWERGHSALLWCPPPAPRQSQTAPPGPGTCFATHLAGKGAEKSAALPQQAPRRPAAPRSGRALPRGEGLRRPPGCCGGPAGRCPWHTGNAVVSAREHAAAALPDPRTPVPRGKGHGRVSQGDALPGVLPPSQGSRPCSEAHTFTDALLLLAAPTALPVILSLRTPNPRSRPPDLAHHPVDSPASRFLVPTSMTIPRHSTG